MEFFQVNLLGAGGAERVRAPFCSCAARSLARTPSPSSCVWPFPLRASPCSLPLPLHASLPLMHIPPGHSPSPCARPFPLHASPPVPPAPPPLRAKREGVHAGRG